MEAVQHACPRQMLTDINGETSFRFSYVGHRLDDLIWERALNFYPDYAYSLKSHDFLTIMNARFSNDGMPPIFLDVWVTMPGPNLEGLFHEHSSPWAERLRFEIGLDDIGRMTVKPHPAAERMLYPLAEFDIAAWGFEF